MNINEEFAKYIITNDLLSIDDATKKQLLQAMEHGYNLKFSFDANFPEKVLEIASNFSGLSIEDIVSENRGKYNTNIRIAICKILTDKGYTAVGIGKLLNRNHSTILHLLRKSDDLIFLNDKNYKEMLKKFQSAIA